jgi:hypothetical protein
MKIMYNKWNKKSFLTEEAKSNFGYVLNEMNRQSSKFSFRKNYQIFGFKELFSWENFGALAENKQKNPKLLEFLAQNANALKLKIP